MQDAVETGIREVESLMEQGQAPEAMARLRELVAETERSGEADARVLATLYDHLGLAYRAMAQMSHAQASFMRAYEHTLAFAAYDRLSAVVSMHFGELCRWQGLLAEAIVHLGEAHPFFFKTSDRRNEAWALWQAGLTYEAMGDVDVAKRSYFHALSISQVEQLPALTRDVRQQYAFSVLGMRDVQGAVEELEHCAQAYHAAGDIGGESQTYARIGAVYLLHNRTEEAGRTLQQALGRFTEEMAARDPRLPEVYHVQAQYMMKLKKYVQAIEYSDRAGQMFAKMGLELASVDALKISVKASQLLQSRESMKRVMELLASDESSDLW